MDATTLSPCFITVEQYIIIELHRHNYASYLLNLIPVKYTFFGTLAVCTMHLRILNNT